MSHSWIGVAAVVVLLVASMAALSAAARRCDLPREVLRKALHVEIDRKSVV